MEEVIYKPVVGYEGLYEVGSLGEVFSLNYNKTGKRVKLKPGNSSNGYLQVVLCNSGKMRKCFVHRLVAEAFIPNPDCKPEVDHINTDKMDNRVENLRWTTRMENQHNPTTEVKYRFGMQKRAQNEEWVRSVRESNVLYKSKAVYCIELDEVFESAVVAAMVLGLDRSHITSCCLGKRKTHGGYHFRFNIQE